MKASTEDHDYAGLRPRWASRHSARRQRLVTRHSARCGVFDLAPPLVQKTASLCEVCIQLVCKEGNKVQRHPLPANDLFCRKVSADLGNLIPFPIEKS